MAVLFRQRADGGSLFLGLIPREPALYEGLLSELAGALARILPLLTPAGGRAGTGALGVHQLVERALVHSQALLPQQLLRQVEREPERVVQLKGVIGCDAIAARLPGPRDLRIEVAEALLQCVSEGLLLR